MTIRCLTMAVVSLSCLGCRTAEPLHREGPTSPINDPATAQAQAKPAVQNTVVLAYYFHRTLRCHSCLLMETTAAREIEEHFARQIQEGQVVWTSVDIEDPSAEALRQQLDVRSNGLVLARVENGVYKDSKSLDKLWGLLGRPDDFSKCVVDEVNACLSGAHER